MRSLRLLVPLLALAALLPAPAWAADMRQGTEVTIGSEQTVTDDVYLAGGTIDVSGTVDGDLVVFGGNVTMSGTVTRDLMVAGGTVTVPGEVRGSVRVAGGTLTVGGPVGEDVLMAGGALEVGPNATVGRDLVVGGGTVTVDGSVGRRVLASAGTLTLRGPVAGDVRADVTTLRLEQGAVVGGDLVYTSANQAIMAPGARVNGRARHDLPAAERRSLAERFLDGLLGWLRALVGLFLLGLVVVLLFPRLSRGAVEAFTRSPWASFGLGAALLAGVPIAAVFVFAAGLAVGGWWLALMLASLYAIALAVAYVVAGVFVGRRGLALVGRPEVHPLVALLAGLVVLTLVGLVPYFGGLVSVVAVVFGLGALTVTLWRGRPARPA